MNHRPHSLERSAYSKRNLLLTTNALRLMVRRLWEFEAICKENSVRLLRFIEALCNFCPVARAIPDEITAPREVTPGVVRLFGREHDRERSTMVRDTGFEPVTPTVSR